MREQRRLARARGADHRDRLAGRDREVDLAQNDEVASRRSSPSCRCRAPLRTLLFCSSLSARCRAAPAAAEDRSWSSATACPRPTASPQERGWVALLGERLKRERLDYSVVNASISGETSGGGARAHRAGARSSTSPAVVILELGGNDGLRGLPVARDEEEPRRDDRAVAARPARACCSSACSMPPNYGAGLHAGLRSRLRRARQAPQDRAGAVPARGLRRQAATSSSPTASIPTEAAQPLMLERVWKALQPLLK